MRSIFACIALGATAPFAFSADVTVKGSLSNDDVAQTPRHVFSLLPKAFQKNPELEMTAFTMVTDYGHTLAPGSLQNPVYYVGRDSGQQSRGDTMGGEHAPAQAVLNDLLQRTLAAAGYLPAKKGNEVGLVLNYFWGSHNRFDADLTGKFPELARQYVLERAVLIGGKAYARKLEDELDSGPFNRDDSLKGEFLKNQALDDLYYVVVSAYNYADLIHNQRHLVWRTTLTVNSRGVSMTQAMPALIVLGENFFGRETSEPMALRRDVRSGTVKLGPLNVLESGFPAPAHAHAN